MPTSRGARKEVRPGLLEVRSPDYHLTPEAPLYAAVHHHTCAGPPALSIHGGLEVGIVLAGREEMQVGETVIEGQPGDVWLCAMSEPHRYRVAAPDTWNLVLVFLPSFLGEEMLGDKPWLTLFAAPPEARPRVTAPETRAYVLEVAREVRHEVEARAAGWQCAVRLNLLRVLLRLSRNWDYRRAVGRGQRLRPMGNLSRIMPALALLSERLPHPLAREDAARACGLGRSRFTALFRETMGVSFQEFRRRSRIAYAATMLLTTALSLEDIAARTGFSDASHLHRAFVQEYGCTPGEYREQGEAAADATRRRAFTTPPAPDYGPSDVSAPSDAP